MITETVEGKVEDIAFGGNGVLREDSFVVFVPFTISDEIVRASIDKRKKSHAFASLTHIVEKSPHRIEPRCPYFTHCGGCQFQHINYPKQLEIKQKMVHDALRRIGHCSIDTPSIEPSPSEWGYRKHISLRLKIENGKVQTAFAHWKDNSLLAINTCPIFEEPSFPSLSQLNDLLNQIDDVSHLDQIEVKVFKHPSKKLLILIKTQLKEASTNLLKSLESISHSPFISGILLTIKGDVYKWGNTELREEIENLIIEYSPLGFIQNNSLVSKKIYFYMRDLLAGAGKKVVLDLYAGVGITSLLLAQQGHKVYSVEISPKSHDLAKRNAALNKLENVEVILSSAEKICHTDFLEKTRLEVAIMNPPRTGIDHAVLGAIINSSCQEIIYISCMPATLARDINVLAAAGFSICELRLFDMFPQTTHVETVVYLKRN